MCPCRKKPLTAHLTEFGDYQRARGTADDHIALVRSRVIRILDDCGFVFPSDVQNDPIQQCIHELNRHLSAQTCNHYITAIKQFISWMKKRNRVCSSVLLDLKKLNVEQDRRHKRRPVSPDEFRRLLAAARKGPRVEAIDGQERAACYLLAASTGLRRKELASLSCKSLCLEEGNAFVVLGAQFTKNKKEARIPLQDIVRRELETWLKSRSVKPSDQLFNLRTASGRLRRTSKMMERDLESARKLWLEEVDDKQERERRDGSDFLRYVSEDTVFADFHANRHTFISNLAEADVSPKVTQELARHGSIDLTMNVYTTIAEERKRHTIESAPALVKLAEESDDDEDPPPAACNGNRTTEPVDGVRFGPLSVASNGPQCP